MGGIKRPAEVSTEEPSGKKNQPVVAKVFPSSRPAEENNPPSLSKTTKPPPHTRNATQVPFESVVPHMHSFINHILKVINWVFLGFKTCQNTYKVQLLHWYYETKISTFPQILMAID